MNCTLRYPALGFFEGFTNTKFTIDAASGKITVSIETIHEQLLGVMCNNLVDFVQTEYFKVSV